MAGGDGAIARLGAVAELWRHPVKSMQGESLASTELGEWGIPGDRRWAVVDEQSGSAMSAKRFPTLLLATAWLEADAVVISLPDGGTGRAGDPALDAALSGLLERAVHLEEASDDGGGHYQANVDSDDDASDVMDLPTPPGTFLDLAAIHLLSDSSLAAMSVIEPTGDFHRARFRPTIFATGTAEGFVEDGWIGLDLAIGSAVVGVFMPCIRCAMPGRAQPGHDKAPDVLRAVNRHHGNTLGVYAAVRRPGTVAVGDPILIAAQ